MRFNNPPFEFETFLIDIDNSGTNMKAHKRKEVQTTDLRLSFAKSKQNDGGRLPNARRELKPLANSEWKAIKTFLFRLNECSRTLRVTKS